MPSLAAAQSITIQGRVLNSGGTPVSGSSTQFRAETAAMQIDRGTGTAIAKVTFPNGDVAIGTSTPAAKLDVHGGAAPLRLRNTTYANSWLVGPDSSNSFVVYNSGSTGVYVGNGNTAWSANSDRRVKKEIREIENSLDKALRLNGVTYLYTSEASGDPRHAGVIAQDVQAVLPEAVTERDGILGVKYTEIIPLVINALKEFHQKWSDDSKGIHETLAKKDAEIKNLRKENEAMKARLDRIERALASQPAAPAKK